MTLLTTLAVCSHLIMGSPEFIQKECLRATQTYQTHLKTLKLSANDKRAIARVSYAEAKNQGEAGLAGVVYTILNRLISGKFGKTITQIVNSPHQFEPVHRVGGWQNLPTIDETQQAKINTIITLEGHLPDVTKGALFFQNPKIVMMREAKGTVSKGLTHFGGSKPSVIIKDHAFYHEIDNHNLVTLNTKALPRIHKHTAEQTLHIIQTKKTKSQRHDVFTAQKADIFVHKTTPKTLLVSIQ
jgi:N-acetylmuramoyl-L-alanine amidase